jgi:hypothetical protein
MKKITLLMIFVLVWSFNSNAQYLDENFESGTFPPAGWVDEAGTVLADNGDSWGESTVQANSPTTSAFFDDFGTNQDHDRWLISPAIDLSGAVNPELIYFDYVNFSTFADTHDVLWSEDYSGSGDPGLATWNSLNTVIGTEDTWVENGPYPIVSSGSQVYIAFHYLGTFAAEWWIDDVLVRDALTCTSTVVNGTSIVNDCDNGLFQIDVDVDTVGDGTIINDGTNTFTIAAGSNLVGPYASGSTVSLTIEHSDSACNFTMSDITFTCPTIPTVAGTLTINGCLDSDTFTTAFDGSVQSFYWIQLDYDGGCFELTADTDGSDFDTELGMYDSNGFLVANNDDDAGGITPQSLFTELALPAGTYYLAAGEFNMTFGPDNFNVTFPGTPNDTGTLVVNASTPSNNTVDFCNLQFPFEGDIQTGEDHPVYTQVYEAGVTEPQGAQGAGIEAWIGFSQTDATTTADFTSGDWTWVVADYNTSGPASNNDEYFAEIGSARTEGTYYYVSRYSIDGGPYSYGGINPGGSDGNFWDGTNFVSGQLTVTNPPPPANDLCENATPIACDDILTGQTTIQATGGSGTSCNGTIGNDVWYQLSGNDTEVTITVDASVQEAQIGIFESTDGTCAGFTLGNCIASVDDLGGNPTSVSFLASSGFEYFIQVGNWINGDPGLVFQISATCTTCPAPSNLDADNMTETSAELSWTEGGTSAEWNIEYGAPGFTLGVDGTQLLGVTDNPYTLNGLSSDTDYEYYVQANCGGETSDWTGPFAFSTLPPAPANNACIDAIEVFDGDSVPGNTSAATNVEGITSCEGGTGGTVCTDAGTGIVDFGPGVWYVYTAGPDEDVSIDTEGSAFDTEIQVFTGDCNNLVCLGGDDDGGAGNTSAICWASSATTGTTVDYYIYVDGHATSSGDFILNVNVENTLSITDYDAQDLLTYFPNPVKNELTLKAKSSIQNVSVINMLGQEVLSATPNTIESNLDMNALNQGAYFVKVTINDITETIRIIKQ